MRTALRWIARLCAAALMLWLMFLKPADTGCKLMVMLGLAWFAAECLRDSKTEQRRQRCRRALLNCDFSRPKRPRTFVIPERLVRNL